MNSNTRTDINKYHLSWLITASLLTVLLHVLPFTGILVYPIRLFVTFVHEASHAIATVLTFGKVTGLTISPDESGLTWSVGGFKPLIASAGYLGTTLFGASLLILSQYKSYARNLLLFCGVLTLGVTGLFVNGASSWFILSLSAIAMLFWFLGRRPNINKLFKFIAIAISLFIVLLLVLYLLFTGTLFSWFAGLIIGALFILLGSFSHNTIALFLVNFLAIQCCFNAILDIKTLFFLSLFSKQYTDAAYMQQLTGIPATFWALLWGIIALAALVGSFFVIRRLSNPPVLPVKPEKF